MLPFLPHTHLAHFVLFPGSSVSQYRNYLQLGGGGHSKCYHPNFSLKINSIIQFKKRSVFWVQSAAIDGKISCNVSNSLLCTVLDPEVMFLSLHHKQTVESIFICIVYLRREKKIHQLSTSSFSKAPFLSFKKSLAFIYFYSKASFFNASSENSQSRCKSSRQLANLQHLKISIKTQFLAWLEPHYKCYKA